MLGNNSTDGSVPLTAPKESLNFIEMAMMAPWVMLENFAAIQISLATIIVVLGFSANIVLFVAIMKSTKLHTPSNMIVASMCLLDIWRMIHILALDLVSGISGRWQYNKTTACVYSAIMTSFFGRATGFCLSFVSINRLLMITRHETYLKLFTVHNTATTLIVLFVTSVVSSVPIAVGGTNIYVLFSNHVGSCYAYDADPKKLFQLSGIFCSIILPSIVMVPSYSWIYYFVRRSRRRVAVHGSRPNETRPMVSMGEELRSALVIFLTYITYCLFYTPLYASWLAFIFGVGVSNEVLVVASYLTDFHRFIRPILYPLCGKSYRHAVVRLFVLRPAAATRGVELPKLQPNTSTLGDRSGTYDHHHTKSTSDLC